MSYIRFASVACPHSSFDRPQIFFTTETRRPGETAGDGPGIHG